MNTIFSIHIWFLTFIFTTLLHVTYNMINVPMFTYSIAQSVLDLMLILERRLDKNHNTIAGFTRDLKR